MRCHCVFLKNNLRYDGRVCALIKTLSLSYPNDNIYVYNLTDAEDVVTFPSNVKYKRYKAFARLLFKSHLAQIIKSIEFAIYTFSILFLKSPFSIQVHHEPVILGPLLYKILRPRVIMVYDDKELYLPKNNNIQWCLFKLECILIMKSDLVIVPNENRLRALKYILKLHNRTMLVKNYVFDAHAAVLNDETISLLNQIKNQKYKLLLHQGIISVNRCKDKVRDIIEVLPEDWRMIFIGITQSEYDAFEKEIAIKNRNKIHYIGFIPYEQLNTFWFYVDATLIFYDHFTFNNKYSAPNRLYSAANSGVPIIANAENITLCNFIVQYRSGICIPPMKNVEEFFRKYDEYRKQAKMGIHSFEYVNGCISVLNDFYIKYD